MQISAQNGRLSGYSIKRGINWTKLQGLVRKSSCALINFSHANRQAPEEPGSTKTKVRLATPANARDCRVEVLISS